MRKKEILPFVTRWMEPEGIMLSDMSDRKRQTWNNITYMWNLKKPNS